MEELLTAEARHLHILGATGEIRTATHEGREHLVVPVVALMQGVIHAVNAETPEFVPISSLQSAPQGWNGRPVVLGHPTVNGRQISANSPTVLESQAFGKVFNARVDDLRLLMDAWIDVEKAERIGAGRMLADLRQHRPTEVSVGAFVVTENTSGRWGERDYKAIWRDITPDHIAFLPRGVGACSLDMGCGACRAAAAHLVTAEGFEALIGNGNNQYTTGRASAKKLDRVIGQMKFDERKALEKGYAAEKKNGYEGTLHDFFQEQANLYKDAKEGDPKLKTFFYGNTLDALAKNDDEGNEAPEKDDDELAKLEKSVAGEAEEKDMGLEEKANREKIAKIKRDRAAIGNGNNQYTKGNTSRYPDVHGSEPAKKDVMRVKDILRRAKGNKFKEHALAGQMANAIDHPDKARRRANAAEMHASHLAHTFHSRADALEGYQAPRAATGKEPMTLRERVRTFINELRGLSAEEAEARELIGNGNNQYTKDHATKGKDEHGVTTSDHPSYPDRKIHEGPGGKFTSSGRASGRAVVMDAKGRTVSVHDNKDDAEVAAHQHAKGSDKGDSGDHHDRINAKMAEKPRGFGEATAVWHSEMAKLHNGIDAPEHKTAAEQHKTAADINEGYSVESYGREQAKVESDKAVRSTKLTMKKSGRSAASIYDTPEQVASEEAAELVGYTTLRTLCDQVGESYDAASEIVDELIAAEEESDNIDEQSETELEQARLESLRVLCLAMYSGLNAVMSLSNDMLGEGDEGGEAVNVLPRYAAGRRHSEADLKILQGVHDNVVTLGAECATPGYKAATEHVGGRTAEEELMTKELRAAAIKELIANPHGGFTAADEKMLETASDTRIEAFKAAADKAKVDAEAKAQVDADLKAAQEKAEKTEADLKAAQAAQIPAEELIELRALASAKKAEDAVTKTTLVAKLKDAGAFTEEELNAKGIPELRKLVTLAGIDAGDVPSFEGRSVPRAAGAEDVFSNPPDPYEAGLKAMRAAEAARVQ